MTDSLDARTPSADVHALSGSSRPGAAPPLAPIASVHELPDTFVPLGDAASAAVSGLAARRAAAAHPDAEVIDLAGRVERLNAREDRLVLRVVKIEDGVFKVMRREPTPQLAESELRITTGRTIEPDGTRVMTIREPAGWAAEFNANNEAHKAALEAQKRRSEQEEACRGLPYWAKLRERSSSRLERWGLQLAAMQPTTQAGLAAKARAAAAVVESEELPDPWRQTLSISVSRDAVRLAAPTSSTGDAELLDLIAQQREAMKLSEDTSRAADDASVKVYALRAAVPDALWPRDSDREHGIAPATGQPDDEADTRRFYDGHDVTQIRRFCDFRGSYLKGMGRTEAHDGAAEARRQEIITTIDAWHAAILAEEARSGYDAACQRCDEANGALIDLEERIHGTPARTLAGLVAKAAVELVGARRAELDPTAIAFIEEVATSDPAAAQPLSNIRPAPMPTGFPAGRYPACTSRDEVETYRTFLEMELRFLNWEIYGRAEGGLGYWLDNPADRMHGRGEPPASSRAAAVLALLGLTPEPGRDGRHLVKASAA